MGHNEGEVVVLDAVVLGDCHMLQLLLLKSLVLLRDAKYIDRGAVHLRQLYTNRRSCTRCDNNIYDPDSTCPGRMTAPSAEEAKERWPFCYSSNAKQILKDPRGYQKYYERVYFSRKMELNYFVDKVLWPNKEQHFGKKKLFLLGNSEGGMVAARYYHANMESLLAGRIIFAWSCEYNYFLSCRENAAIGEGHANQDTPVLNMIARKDNFFGEEKSKSVADIVANGSKEDKKDGGAKEGQRYGETGGRLTGKRTAMDDW